MNPIVASLKMPPSDEWRHGSVVGFSSPISYFVEAVGVDMVKIGRSRLVLKRIEDIRSLCPVEVRLLGCVNDDEAELHRKFSHLREHHEWFRLTAEIRDFVDAHRVDEQKFGPFWNSCDEIARAAIREWINSPESDIEEVN